jgi:tight adherence protein B
VAITLIATFTAVFLTVCALYLAIAEARQSPAAELRRRLHRMAHGDASSSEVQARDLLRETPLIEKHLFQLPLMGKIKTLVEHSGIHISPLRFVFFIVMTSASAFVVLFALKRNLLVALLAAVITGAIPCIYLVSCKRQRQARFDEQLPDVLTMVARSLRAGHSLVGAVELVSKELPEPASGLFKIAYEQQKLGLRMTDSLQSLLDKIESLDLHFFVTIIRISSETGGNLSEILDKLSDTIRSRLQIRRQVSVYTAEGRISGYVLVILPVLVFCAFYLLNPAYMDVFFTERTCRISLIAAILAQIAGFLMIRKIVNIRI